MKTGVDPQVGNSARNRLRGCRGSFRRDKAITSRRHLASLRFGFETCEIYDNTVQDEPVSVRPVFRGFFDECTRRQ